MTSKAWENKGKMGVIKKRARQLAKREKIFAVCLIRFYPGYVKNP